ncbi:hypothetical protein [Guptibacillus algicola]|uniref:hypothetical protein n=1 Tax=Guptibacillus algicola TaxID=225844 RepID=UPI001CD7A935|nr:hypothetical protein [Alkalihalobacillus algicola]MCA0986563.1 hypothetical protein [Alkalihalobacillus algicola]
MENKTIEKGRFKARYHNEKTAYIDGLKIFRHKDGIALEFNGQLTSVNDRGKESIRGNNDLYNKLNEVLLELGVEDGEYEKAKREKKDNS